MSRQKLRIITYMCPSHPVEMYEMLMSYLEEELKLDAHLIYESRSPGPLQDRVDPFTDDTVDLAFVTSSAYVKLLDSRNEFAELLPVAAVFNHPKNNEKVPGYYADIIIHIDGKKHVKDFLDLRGCQWAYSHESSLSGSTIILKMLKENGENSRFFGNTIRSGSHLKSLNMVLQKQVEAAAVDSNTLAYYKKLLVDGGKDIFVLDSLGPLPPYPILVNSRMNDELKQKIQNAFLKISDTRLWGERIDKFGISHFTANYKDVYQIERDIQEAVKNTGLGIRYY
uniref:Solute-binding protein family 3/N-terminal domain-containing protein n=1 Tax=Clastoptera arizonana TaxID=38151 RepID=A0A1B6E2R6_9HEMI